MRFFMGVPKVLCHNMKYDNLDNRLRRRAHRIFAIILKKYSSCELPKILDVGCAFGVIGALKGNPKNIFGIEHNPQLIRKAKINCEKVYQIDLNFFKSSQIKESNFDLVFCGDVLEHLLDPKGVLKELISLLAADGLMIISLPNIAQLPYRLKLLFGNFDYTETGVLDENHLHLYTYKTARKLIENTGLKIIDFYASGTAVSFINILPKLLAAQLVFVCQK